MDKLSYSLGILVAQNLKSQGFDEVTAIDLAQGIKDVIENKPLKLTMDEANNLLRSFTEDKSKKMHEPTLKQGMDFLEKNSKRAGVISLKSGLQYEVITEGTGPKPTASDSVTTHYHGTLIDGTIFDSSVQRNQPATFPVNGVIKGWVEALQLMSRGSKWRLFIPYNLAYGSQGAGEIITPYSALIFDIELLGIN